MKKIILLIILFIIPVSLSGQQLSDSIYIISSGNNDRNHSVPKFSKGLGPFVEYGYFVFERMLPDSSVKIMMQKYGYFGKIDEPVEVSEQEGFNPAISYVHKWHGNLHFPTDILILWQAFENGSWNIKGRHFNISTGWSEVLNVSNEPGDELLPRIENKTAEVFIITYQRDGNIFYREFNVITGTISSEQNLTSGITENCVNAFPIHSFNTTFVSFEWVNPNGGFKHIYYISSTQPGVWTEPVPVVNSFHNLSIGVNKSHSSVDFVYMHPIFGEWKIRMKSVEQSGNSFMKIPIIDHFEFSDYYSYAETEILVLIDNFFPIFGYAAEYIDSNVFGVAVQYDNNIVSRIISNPPATYRPYIHVGEYFVHPGVPHHYRNWFLFNDHKSGEYESRIGAFIFTNTITSLSNSGNSVPENYKLHQNFPNPFNPETTISFDIPKVSNVKLTIYNALGREVAVLVNEQLTAGSYNYQLSADDYKLTSGIYFYRLSSEGFSETKKFVLLK